MDNNTNISPLLNHYALFYDYIYIIVPTFWDIAKFVLLINTKRQN